jgi:hypothetical protein
MGWILKVNKQNMKNTKLLGLLLVSIMASGLLVADTANAQITNKQPPEPLQGKKMQNRPGGMEMRDGIPGIMGKITEISGTSLTIVSPAMGQTATTTYVVDASSAIVMKNNATSTFSSIAVGDMVMVKGTISGTVVTATIIFDGKFQGKMGPDGNKVPNEEKLRNENGEGAENKQTSIIQGNGQPVVGGIVATIDGTLLTITNVSNVTYMVDASSATVIKNNATSTLSNVTVGDQIIVQGTVNGNSIVASSIIDQEKPSEMASSTPASGNRGGGFFGAIKGFFHKIFGFF